ncbi:MAG TPA: hypothetical protein VLA12_03565 [Planctomycetaceae bacterium]|nr:hypothetical protein [Planctomycetaceae bacterium]
MSVEFARKLERERDEARKWNAEGKINGSRCAEERDRLQDAIRAYQKTDGLYPTTREAALRRIYSLLPENADMRRDAEDVRPT